MSKLKQLKIETLMLPPTQNHLHNITMKLPPYKKNIT